MRLARKGVRVSPRPSGCRTESLLGRQTGTTSTGSSITGWKTPSRPNNPDNPDPAYNLASLLMGAAVWTGARMVAALPLAVRMRDLIDVAVLIPAACGLYGALLWMLRIEGRLREFRGGERWPRRRRAGGRAVSGRAVTAGRGEG